MREGNGKGYTVPQHLIRSVRRMAMSGRSIAQIVRATGLSRGTVRKLLVIDRSRGDSDTPNG